LARESDFEVSPTILSRYPILMDTTVVIADRWCETRPRHVGISLTATLRMTTRPPFWRLEPRSLWWGRTGDGRSLSRAFSPASSRLPLNLTKYSRRSRFRFRRPQAAAHT